MMRLVLLLMMQLRRMMATKLGLLLVLLVMRVMVVVVLGRYRGPVGRTDDLIVAWRLLAQDEVGVRIERCRTGD
uniref:Putative secreted peptide n=1 Tax=Anopheles braziliensis TaxID=58242 RepID=A0A2M3ZV14_9DIPT